jgi:SpoIVB peptidase S55
VRLKDKREGPDVCLPSFIQQGAGRKGTPMKMGRGSAAAAALAAVGLVASALVVPGLAAEPSGPSDCPDILPVSEVTDGMLATGWTVVRSETPKSFNVEVLGVLQDGIAPGRDMIVVEVSGPVISNNGNGIWFGMSGSPVYHDGDLIGAVAWGLSGGPSRIGGVTPAEYMLDIPDTSDEQSEVRLSREERERIAQAAGTSSEDMSESFVQLKTPLSIGGVSSRVRKIIAKTVKREELPLIPHAGGTTGSGNLQTTSTPPSAGQSIAGALSYGDVSFAGVGTTTMVCDGRAYAFGHPFMWTGDAVWGAARARSLTIVRDPLFGPYKLANIGATFGVLDQDRLAGIAGDVGAPPPVIPLKSTFTDLDLGRTRTGHTLAVPSDFAPFIALSHLLSNADVTIDRIGKGSSSVTWTLEGTSADGPWTVSRTNRFASTDDISYVTISEVEEAIFTLLFSGFEGVEITSLDFDAEIEKEVERYTIQRALVARNGASFANAGKIGVKPGDTIRVRTVMLDEEGDRRLAHTSFVVPNRFKGGSLQVGEGGGDGFFVECFSEYGECMSHNSTVSIHRLADRLESKPKNNELVTIFRSNRGRQTSVVSLDQVVTGGDFVRIVRKGQTGGSGGGGTSKPSPGK